MELGTIGELIKKLVAEHRDFSSQTERLDRSLRESQTFHQLSEIFTPLKEALIDHMLVEETEIFPEVSARGLFSERVSEIMQQHLDITAALDRMKFAIHGKNLGAAGEAFNELLSAMKIHFPAEESEVFSLLS